MHETEGAARAGSPDGTQYVRSPERIAALLQGVREESALVSVSIPGTPAAYSSALLRISEPNGPVVLDELAPSEGHSRLLAAGRGSVRARLRGVTVEFSAELLGHGVSEGIAYYEVAFPDVLLYAQRRSFFRTRLAARDRVSVRLRTAAEDLWDGHLCDLSVGGVGVIFLAVGPPAADALPGLDAGDRVLECSLRLGDEDIRSVLEVRWVRRVAEPPGLRLGGRFARLDKPQEMLIEHFVRQAERELLKRR